MTTTLATYSYDELGQRKRLTYGNGVVVDCGFDPASRLDALDLNLSGTANDVSSAATRRGNPPHHRNSRDIQ